MRRGSGTPDETRTAVDRLSRCKARLIAFGSEYLVFSLISRYVLHVCPACAASHFDEATAHRFGVIAGAMVITIAVHSTIDGLALPAGEEAEMTGPLDLGLLLAVCVDKVPEGLALGALMLGAGFQRGVALGWVAAVEATTLVGGALGLWVLPGMSSAWLDVFVRLLDKLWAPRA